MRAIVVNHEFASSGALCLVDTVRPTSGINYLPYKGRASDECYQDVLTAVVVLQSVSVIKVAWLQKSPLGSNYWLCGAELGLSCGRTGSVYRVEFQGQFYLVLTSHTNFGWLLVAGQ